MNILAIDTANEYLSLAIQTTDKIYKYQNKIGNKQSEFILPTIHNLLIEANIGINDISAIAYNAGPGGFTGLRIGLSTSLALSYSINCQLYPIHMFQIYAYSISTSHRYNIIALDAKLGQLYIAIFDKQLLCYAVNPILINPAQINETITSYSNNSVVIGNGWNLYKQNIKPDLFDQITYLESGYPTADTLFKIINTGLITPCKTQEAELLYLRDKVALSLEEQLLNKQK
ncbi:MAG: tRNA (adenosine(37)-N6)-threonylcarbamoyltransferase complex dimerization subunit type 1 TsaB [Burkholderiales bacterium]|nr:tRNA (adenosine(37)-N6)-threonylcarbamoyltransferase complex dimerization subunit type 1 TsaB [Burkholderiales bacterium]